MLPCSPSTVSPLNFLSPFSNAPSSSMVASEFILDDENFDDAFFAEVDKSISSSTQQQQQIHRESSISDTVTHFPNPVLPQPNPNFSHSSTSNRSVISLFSEQQQQQIQQHSFYSINPQIPESSIVNAVTHSPPRELSQRNPNSTSTTRSVSSPFSDEQNLEIQRLKTELSSVSKELLDLRQECSELKRQNAREQQLKFAHPHKKPRTSKSQDHDTNGVSLGGEISNIIAVHAAPKTGIEKKSTGIQTDEGDESLSPSTSGTKSTHVYFTSLVSIWSPLSSLRSKRNFVAKLLEACASDFCDLFTCLGSNITSKMDSKFLTHTSVPGRFLDLDSDEVSRVSKLYIELTKLADDMAHINAFLTVLLDLCSLENVLVVFRSLRILHIALDRMLSIDRTCPKRDNVKAKRDSSGSDAVHLHDSEVDKSNGSDDCSGDGTSPSRCIAAGKNTCMAESEELSFLCHVDWHHLFMSLRQVALKMTEERAKVEAVSIMNIILMRTDPCSTRAKYGNSLVFEAVTLLLKKEAGFSCRKEAVHLLYLLLNCTTILSTFCSSCNQDDSHTQSPTDGAIILACHESRAVLEELAECIACSGYGVKELNLCRNAIIVLSFLASSGICGFKCFLFHKLSNRANFLVLILKVLVGEIDAESLESCPASDVSKERTLLMREALILLNRLASHPAYSATVLQELTSCRDMISLAIDTATRLSKKSRRLLKADHITRQMREFEVVDLACLFRKRIFTFLGETLS